MIDRIVPTVRSFRQEFSWVGLYNTYVPAMSAPYERMLKSDVEYPFVINMASLKETSV